MLLIANRISFRQVRQELRVEFFRRSQPKVMNVVSGRDGLDLVEPPALDAPRQNQMTGKPAFPRRYLSEGHSSLQGDPRLLGQTHHRSKQAHSPNELIEKRSHFGGLVQKVMVQFELAARV